MGGHITDRLARLHPLLALVAFFGVVAVAEVAGFSAAEFFEPTGFHPRSLIYVTVTTAVGMLYYLGYPVAVGIHVLKARGPVTQVIPARVTTAVLVMPVAYTVGMVNTAWHVPSGSGSGIIMGGVVFAWLAGALYILWTAARGLVQAEEGRVVAFNRMIGTFLMFYFLPLGIYFLQRRVRCLEVGRTA